MMKKLRLLKTALAGLVATTSLFCTMTTANAEIVYNTQDGFTYSCYDINKDGNVNVFDLVAVKKFLLNQSADEDLEIAFENYNTITEIEQTTKDYINRKNPALFARITDISIDAMVYEGRIHHYDSSTLITVTFDDELTEDEMYSLQPAYNESGYEWRPNGDVISNAIDNRCKRMRFVYDNEMGLGGTSSSKYTGVIAAIPCILESGIRSYTNMKEFDISEIIVWDYIKSKEPGWLAKITDIAGFKFNAEEYLRRGIITVTFDEPLDEDTLISLCPGEIQSEEDLQYYMNNKCSKIRFAIDKTSTSSSEHFEKVVPIIDSNDIYDVETTIVEGPTEETFETIATQFLMDKSPEWYAKLKKINTVTSAGSSLTGELTLEFDRPLNENAVNQLCVGVSDVESEAEYAVKNSLSKMKVIVIRGVIKTVVPIE